MFSEARSRRHTGHWDSGPETVGPFIFSFYTEVRPRGGGTMILSGSHHLLSQFYKSLSIEEKAYTHKNIGRCRRIGIPGLRISSFIYQPELPS
jgi:hypothetical protein